MSKKRANEGSVADHSEPGRIEGRLYDFRIDSDTVLLMHSLWLKDHVVPVLTAGGSVAITGLTSRSGSIAHNLKLSERRANAVLTSLRLQVFGPMPYRMNTGFRVSHAIGVGESKARQAGQEDGTEDGFYRAVLVTAWYNPNPPPPPEPKPKPTAPLVRRVTSRRWNKFNTRSRTETGETGMELGDLLSDIISGAKDGGSDTRTHAMIPSDHVVTHVLEDFAVIDDIGMGISTITYDKTIQYAWGPPVEWIRLVKRSKHVLNGRDPGWEVKKDVYKRNEIWKHTTPPDSTVYW